MKKFLSMLALVAFLSVSTISAIGCGDDKDKAKKDAPAKEKDKEVKKEKDAPK